MRTFCDLRSSSAYRDLLHATPIGMCLVDPVFHYHQVNATWAGILGYAPEELTRRALVDTTYLPDRGKVTALTGSIPSGSRETASVNKRVVHSDGTLIRVTVTITALRDPQLFGYYLATLVPDRNQVFDDLRTQKIAHDLRSLLHNIGLCADSMQNPIAERLPPLCESIQESVHLAANLVSNLSGAEKSPQGSCSAPSVLQSCIAIIEATLPSTIRLRSRLMGEPIVCLTEVKLSELVLNLLTNARDAMTNSGTIDVRCETQNNLVVISIRDEGLGMTPDEIDECVKTYSSSKSASGSGLGLSIVQSTLDAVGGYMEITSVKNLGTTVVCKIPRVIEKEKNTNRDAPVAQDCKYGDSVSRPNW